MKLDMRKDEGQLAFTIYLNAISTDKNKEKFEEMLKKEDFDPTNIDVKMIANGIEFDFSSFIETVELFMNEIQELEDMQFKKFKKIYEDRLNKKWIEKLESFEKTLDGATYELNVIKDEIRGMTEKIWER